MYVWNPVGCHDGGMRLGLVADTHIPEAGPDLPDAAYRALTGCDRILHGGDLHCIEVVDRLERLAPVLAARGNGDTLQPYYGRPGVGEDPRVAQLFVLDVEGFRIGLTHDLEEADGRPDEIAADVVHRRFGQHVDIAICGHTHVPMGWGLVGGTCLINPGSPTMPYGYVNVLGTVGLLDIRPGAFDLSIINLDTGATDVSLAGPAAVPCRRGPRPRLP
jgi:putative phosphoesterase